MVLKKIIWALLLSGGLLLSACTAEPQVELVVPTQIITTPTPIPTVEPTEVLSICLGQEPGSLFLYGNNSLGARVVRQALYDTPVAVPGEKASPAILERIPSRANGDVQFVTIDVDPGWEIVDNDGNLTYLTPGVEYRPAGCFSGDCAETYAGVGPVTMDQVVITYQLRDDVRWSDGTPLTAADSVYSYEVAQALFATRAPGIMSTTQAYWAPDEQTVKWRGLPGFQGLPAYTDPFFTPLPQHLWGTMAPQDLLSSETSTRFPLGWGPYQIQDWKTGYHISLTRNPYYFQRENGLPYYDELVYRFVDDGEEAITALLSGECEIAVGVTYPRADYQDIQDLQAAGALKVVHQNGRAWEQISFGIQRMDESPSVFENPEVRRAFAQCIDREAVVEVVPAAGWVVESFFGRAAGEEQAKSLPYDPQGAGQLLEQGGWVDHDGDPDTPRQAQGVPGFEDGTKLVVEYLVAGSAPPETARIVQDSLSQCGVEVLINATDPEQMLAPGPEGPVFGRDFDLAQFAWTSVGERLCALFTSREIPGPYPEYPKGWGGANAPGYQNVDYDQACHQVLTTLPDSGSASQALQDTIEILQQELPAIPLYYRHDVLLLTPELQGLESGHVPLLYRLAEVFPLE
jgi:peptide/nickel transport system substrate-binding protein